MKTVPAVSSRDLPDAALARLLADAYARLIESEYDEDEARENLRNRILNLRPAITEAIRRLQTRTP